LVGEQNDGSCKQFHKEHDDPCIFHFRDEHGVEHSSGKAVTEAETLPATGVRPR
jgi:hypothetical protein